MNYTIFSSQRIGVEVTTSPSCFCDLTANIFHDDFCIPNRLLLEYQQYQGFRPTSTIFQQVKHLMLFCHLVKNQTACQQLANLCVLSFYSLGRSSPCNLFYTTQTSELALNYGEKTRPYLFYRKGKYVTELLDKIIDHPYDIKEHNKVGNLNVSSIFNSFSLPTILANLKKNSMTYRCFNCYRNLIGRLINDSWPKLFLS